LSHSNKTLFLHHDYWLGARSSGGWLSRKCNRWWYQLQADNKWRILYLSGKNQVWKKIL